jgi:hypothetical protein
MEVDDSALANEVRLVAAGLLTLADIVLFAGMVGDGTAPSTDGTTDECAFASPGDGADCGTACGRASDDLGTGVVAVVTAGLGTFGFAMFAVRCLRGKGHICSYEKCCGDQ